ncbi:bifunctional tRNA pseudouridine(32) synthase/23S rRNA pseudouridine(746) synthase RluA [Enterovibrio sp. ZSDZ42]|uniref:Pseudouridine synthase n=1 Tax=Enterovibrio gelatinilyticus TaxID=2899819 RepID=A0ABT5R0T2_9GAMM|nr:bifunctional tRNA pseudouridine(32) synthase/23S rRNA pseudouridine(746) synthase RluA [Enterovibrio sp. ZSDZ42]MDD1793883.1 bifunctional tRNA pseudouridine(32) synthase/23S rRNA pseudouridine(746) synthase RluA [Enterovibrio sp. ZSDZ42]
MSDFIYNPPTEPWLDVIYQDDDIIALNKPSGLLTNPGRDPAHYDSAWSRIKKEFPNAELVHRLDMSTSGLIVFAKHKEAERHLKAQFRERITHKLYYARVWGNVENDEGRVDLPLICDWPNRPKQMVCFENGKPSVTDYEVIKREKKTTLMRLLPITGRSHQLRVHMLALEHPIVGDEFYAYPQAYKYSPRLQLHAGELCFLHPGTGEPMHLSAPCDFYANAPSDTLVKRGIQADPSLLK